MTLLCPNVVSCLLFPNHCLLSPLKDRSPNWLIDQFYLVACLKALQNWKEQFKGLYPSFGADQPGPAFATVPNPAFAGRRFEPPRGSTANSHEFECAVSALPL